jgi:predicted HTH transcriptional regulator
MALFSPDEVSRIIAEGEGRQVELKEGLAADGRVARTICAFANTRGGVLLVGVSDRGRILGASRPRAVVAGLGRLASRAVDPPVDVRIESVRMGSVQVVCCSTPLSPLRPHAVFDPESGAREVLVRVGASNRAAQAQAIASMGTPSSRAMVPDPLEARILRDLGVPTTIARFAAASGVGKQRVRQAFERLERAGLLVAHGLGDLRTYRPA